MSLKIQTEQITVDTLIIGAGVIGSSVAMHLAQKGMTSVRVLDFDLDGSLSSSELNAGGVRATWNEPINVAMARSSIDYFDQHSNDVGFRAAGYLWLHYEKDLPQAFDRARRQSDAGWPVDAWSVKQLREAVPFLDKGGLGGAVFSKKDGLINPNLLKNHYRAHAKAKGVIFEDRALVRELIPCGAGGEFKVIAERFESVMSHETKLEILSPSGGFPAHYTRSKIEYRAQQVINCAGPWASRVAQVMGYSTPVFPVRRQISLFDCREVDLSPYGMIVDPSGVYFHPEATHALSGFATHEPQGINYVYDGEEFFQEHIWSVLYERATAFEKLRHLTGWAGLYEVSPDECAVIGSVADSPGLFEAHSFSGHGVMHSYAAGLGLAEKILTGRFESFDLNALSGERFKQGKMLAEQMVI